jgi:thiamine pyrophosphate-dependent acetolactate synthase large subunit-like protein
MTLGKFHPVDVPLWGDIGRTLDVLREALPEADRPAQRTGIARRVERWRAEKARRPRSATVAAGCIPPRSSRPCPRQHPATP